MLSGVHRWRVRGTLMAALIMGALAMSCATARADGSVEVVGVSGAVQTVELSELGTPDVPDDTYSSVATADGAPQTVTVTDGYSLTRILKYVLGPTHLASFGSAEIVAPEGPPVVLTNVQATSPSAYGDGPPVVWGGGAGTNFLVPSTPTGLTNAGETFSGGTITITLRSGPPLDVGIYALEVKAIVNKPVQFHSEIYGGTPLSYQWSLGDGSSASEASPTHVYTALGTYNVWLEVTGSPDAVGVSAVIHIVVGNPPPTISTAGAGTAGTGTGSGTGTSGSGTGAGAGTGTTTTATAAPAPSHRTARSRGHRSKRVPRPTGPLVSGIAISYVTPAASAAAAAAGAAHAARSAHLRAAASGLRVGMWIWFAVLVALFGGAILEWNGSWLGRRTIPELPRASNAASPTET